MRGMTKRSLTGPLAALLLLIAELVASGVPTASAQYAPCARALPLAAAVAWPATPPASKWQNKIWMVTGVKPAS